jgi:hypothetical protein
MESVEMEICERLQKFSVEAGLLDLSDGKWTEGMMRALGELGRSLGYDVCTSGWRIDGDPRCWGEWLYDMTWAQMDEQGHLVSIPLVLESEWSSRPADVDADFQKLLVARANFRVMIFQEPSCCEFDSTVERLSSHVRAFEGAQVGDRYLFAGYCFTHKSVIYGTIWQLSLSKLT